MKESPVVIRGVSLLAAGLCTLLAIGAGFQSNAETSFKEGEFSQAAREAARAVRLDLGHADSLFVRGLSHWTLGIRSKDPQELSQAEKIFQQLTHKHPSFAKGWFYRALSEKQTAAHIEQQEQIGVLLDKALQLEPHSAWMNVYTSLEKMGILSEDKSSKENRFLIKRLRRALGYHYLYQTSPYLDDVYRRLTEYGYDDRVLQKVTPREAKSYFRLLEFYKKNGNVQAYSRAEDGYFLLRRKLYRNLCDEADGWLEKGLNRRAHEAYRFAREQQPHSLRAQAGLFASREPSVPWTTSDDRLLEDMLMQEEVDLNFYWAYLSSRINQSGDVKIKAMGAFRQRHFDKAIEYYRRLDAASVKDLRRFFAQALIEQGLRNEAWEVLNSALSEPQTDLRDLMLLKQIVDKQSGDDTRLEAKISSDVSRRMAGNAWYSEETQKGNRVSPGVFTGISVNLLPGRVRLEVLMKLEMSEAFTGAVHLKVWEDNRELYSGIAPVGQRWVKPHWDFETTGGWRWIQVFLDPAFIPASLDDREFILRLGTIQIEYPE